MTQIYLFPSFSAAIQLVYQNPDDKKFQQQNYTCHCWIRYYYSLFCNLLHGVGTNGHPTTYGIITNVSMIGMAITGEYT
jgi:hypothetical protein